MNAVSSEVKQCGKYWAIVFLVNPKTGVLWKYVYTTKKAAEEVAARLDAEPLPDKMNFYKLGPKEQFAVSPKVFKDSKIGAHFVTNGYAWNKEFQNFVGKDLLT